MDFFHPTPGEIIFASINDYKMKRLAIPVSENKLSEYFGNCSHYEVFTFEGEFVKNREVVLPSVKEVTALPEWASTMGITDIITHRIDKRIIALFNRYKINLFVGINIAAPENLAKEFLNEEMISNQKIISEIINS